MTLTASGNGVTDLYTVEGLRFRCSIAESCELKQHVVLEEAFLATLREEGTYHISQDHFVRQKIST
jgi:hypothetical protein